MVIIHHVVGTSIGAAALGSNTAQADTNTHMTVDIGKENYKTDADGNYLTDVVIYGESAVRQEANVDGLSVGGVLVTANNDAITNSTNTMKLNVAGGNVKSLEFLAAGSAGSNAYANGDGGGAITASTGVAYTKNYFDNTVAAELDGTWNIAGDLNMGASQIDTSDMLADAANGGAVAITGTQAETTIKGATSATIGAGAILSAQTVNVNAENDVQTGKKYDYATNSVLGGAIAGTGVKSTSDINKSATVNIGDGATVNTTKTQDYEAVTVVDLKNAIRANVVGVAGGATALAENIFTDTNTVAVGKDAVLKNTGLYKNGGLTLSAYDELDMVNTADSIIAGVATVATGESKNTITRNNKVNVYGTLDSMKDVNLYAGAESDGSASKMNLHEAAAAYNHSAIPLTTSPEITTTVTENNQVYVGTSGGVTAVRHINATADSGRDNVKKEASLFSWLHGGSNTDIDFVGSANGKIEYGQTKDNYVKVDGSLAAGVENTLTITIDGVIVPDDSVIAGRTTNNELSIYTAGNAEILKGIKVTSTDYGNDLYTYWQNLCKLISEYQGTNSQGEKLAAYAGYLAEKSRVEQEMMDKGLAEKIVDSAGNVSYSPISGYTVPVITLPDMAASGGNININTDSLFGSGSMEAKGSPSITITNRSPAYLKLGNITIGDPGGQILFNGTNVGGNSSVPISVLNGAITKLNIMTKIGTDAEGKDITRQYAATFNKVKADTNGSTAAAVTVTNDYDKGAISVTANADKLKDSINQSFMEEYANDKATELALAEYKTLLSNKRAVIRSSYPGKTDAELDKIIMENQTYAQGIYDGLVAYFNKEDVQQQISDYVTSQKDTIDAKTTEAYNAAYYDENGNVKEKTFTPLTTVEVSGLINNAAGTVTIENRVGDILIKSTEGDTTAGVNAKKTVMTAPKGSITQGVTTGITNIGGDPMYQYAEYATNQIKSTYAYNHPESVSHTVITGEGLPQALDSQLKDKYKVNATRIIREFYGLSMNKEFSGLFKALAMNSYAQVKSLLENENRTYYAKIITEDATLMSQLNKSGASDLVKRAQEISADYDKNVASDSGRVAGGNIYLNGENINVNGLLQSGFAVYKATIDADALSDDNLSKMKNNASRQATVGGITMYKVNDGGRAVWQDDGTYAYEVQVYYNPNTEKLVVEDIDTHGGQIWLTGNISSTGSGRIYAMDGGADIAITNNSTLDLNVGKIANNDIEGKVTITDLANDMQTIYTTAQTTVINDYANYLKSGGTIASDVVTTASSRDAIRSYYPKTGLRHNWTEGTSATVSKTYETDLRTGWFTKDKSSEELTNAEKDMSPLITVSKGDKDTGSFISVDTANVNTPYMLTADSVVHDFQVTNIQNWTSRSGFLGWFKHYHSRWTWVFGSSQSYVNSIKADNKISVQFIGKDNGNIAVNSGGNINLTGPVLNNAAAATLTINSQGGAINQDAGTTLQDNDVTLKAVSGIHGIDITSLQQDTVDLTATTTTGDIDVNVSGDLVNNVALAGNANIRALTTSLTDGTVTLTSAGNITQAGIGTVVQGRRINLTSTNGAIGTSQQYLGAYGGQTVAGTEDTLRASVNGQAKGDIFLKEDNGGMRVGTIVSSEGNVSVEVPHGTLMDALPSTKVDNDTDANTLIKRWTDAGLIAGEGAYTKRASQAVDDFKTNATNEMKEYVTLNAYYKAHPDVAVSKAYTQLKAIYDTYVTTDMTSTDETTATTAITAGINKYLTDQSTDNKSIYATLLAKKNKPEYGWTKEQLLYAIEDSIVNKAVGSTDKEKKQANISGKDVTLKGVGIGVNKPAVTYDVTNMNLTDTSNAQVLAILKAVDSAEAADVQWNITKAKDAASTEDVTNEIIIGGKVPIGINATGVLTVTTAENAYVAGRSNSKETYAPLNVGIVAAGGDVRLLGKAGVFNALTKDGTNITGVNAVIEGGIDTGTDSVDIGKSDKYLTVDLKGGLTARTDGNIYIKGNNADHDLLIDSIYAKKDLDLTSNRSILMDPNASALAYVNVGGILNLTADADDNGTGDVGTSTDGIRIKNSDSTSTAQVNAKGNNVYLSGKTDGQLALGTITATSGSVGVTSEGATVVKGSVTAQKNSSLEAATDLLLSGPVSVGNGFDGQQLSLEAVKGSITQTNPADTIKRILADGVSATSNKGQSLENTGNIFNSYTLNGETNSTVNGDVNVKTNAVKGLTANLNNSLVMGDVNITNLAVGTAAGVTLTGGVTTIDSTENPGTVAGNVSVMSDGTVANQGAIASIGNITLKSASGAVSNAAAINANKKVLLAAKNGVMNTQAVSGAKLSPTDDVVFSTDTGDIVNTGDVTSTKGKVDLTATAGTVDNQAGVTAYTDVTLKGQAVKNSGAVTATTKAVTLTATDGTITNGNTVIGETDVLMDATKGIANDGAVTANNGQVKLTTTAGDVTNKQTVEAKQGPVTMTATAGTVDNQAGVTAYTDVTLKGQAVKNSGAVTATTEAVTLTATDGTITNGNTVIGGTDVLMDATKGITNNGAVTATTKAVTLTATDGAVTNGSTVSAGTDAIIQAQTDISNTGAVTSETGKVDLTATTGHILNQGAVEAKGTDVLMTAKNGTIENQADVTAKRDVILLAKNIIDSGITATEGKVDLTATDAAIVNNGAITAGTDATMTAQTDIVNNAIVRSTAGKVDLTATTGSLTNNGIDAKTTASLTAGTAILNRDSVHSGQSMTMQADGDITNDQDVVGTDVAMTVKEAGNIVNNGPVTAKTNNVTLATKHGDITNLSQVTGQQNVSMTTVDGKIKAQGDITATAGDAVLKATTGRVEVGTADKAVLIKAGNKANLSTDSTTKSDVEIYGDIQGSKGISLSTNVGDIIWHGHGTAAQGSITATTGSGDMTTQTLDAGTDISLQAKNGTINSNGALNAGNDASLHTGTGDINVNGNITANRNVELHADTGNIKAADGTVISANTGDAAIASEQGDITLSELYALQHAGVDAKDGNVKIFRIDGEDILIAVRTPGKTLDADTVIGGKKVALVGDDIDVGTMSQRSGETDMLLLSPRGTDENKPMNWIRFGQVNLPNGLRIDRLWTNKGDIHVNADKFYIDELGIIDVAHLSNNDTTTTVWGSAPIHDDSNISYWYKPQNHSPWMNLYFTGVPHTQFSNGVLLKYDDYYYAKYDRFSGVNIALKRTDRSEHAFQQVTDYNFDERTGYYYGEYDRYDLLTLDEGILPEAPKADITIQR